MLKKRNSTRNLIEIEALSFRLESRVLFENLSMSLEQGEKTMISGPSGSGKSTLLRCILGLAVPASGVIRIFGRELNATSVWELRRHMAYVAQEPDMGAGTVREILWQPFLFKANASLQNNFDNAPGLMEQFRLPRQLLDKHINTLSGGEKQRIALVSAILLERPILLLDEASSALDPENRNTVIDYFKEAKNTTVLSVSHDSEWQAFCSRSLRLGAESLAANPKN